MDKEDLQALNRARVTAGWSYLGALIPIIGWILGIISLSNIKSIDDDITYKGKKRVASVKKLAIGGILISSLIFFAYSLFTVLSLQNNKKMLNQQQQQVLQESQIDCTSQVMDYDAKILALPGATLKDVAPPNGCKTDTKGTIDFAKSTYQAAINGAKQRCITNASDNYNKYLQLNSTQTTKDASGQPVYRLPQTAIQYAQSTLQQDKNSCAQQFPIATN